MISPNITGKIGSIITHIDLSISFYLNKTRSATVIYSYRYLNKYFNFQLKNIQRCTRTIEESTVNFYKKKSYQYKLT